MTPIGQTIRRLRRDRGMSSNCLAASAGLHTPSLLLLERGKRAQVKGPSILTLQHIAAVLDMPLSALILEWEADQRAA